MKINSYNYRYMNKHQPVFAIVLNNSPKHFGQKSFFTVPLQKEKSNCIVTFLDNQHSMYACKEIESNYGIDCLPEQIHLSALAEFASSINLPTIVVINSYCTIDKSDTVHELYFLHDTDKNIDKNKE